MESTFSKLFTVLVAVGVGYMIYQKTAASPPAIQPDSSKSPKASQMAGTSPTPPIAVPSSEIVPQQPGSQPQEQPPAATSLPRQPEPQTKTADVNDVGAVPLPNPNTQRRAYFDFLAKRNPRAFVICNDGSVKAMAGGSEFISKQLAEGKDRCTPYAIDDAVVWTGK